VLLCTHHFYSHCRFCFFRRLNMVVGPNGTGKVSAFCLVRIFYHWVIWDLTCHLVVLYHLQSTILCAICLGLGGEPRLLGRASDVETFIMNGEDVGEIEIEIVNEDGPNPIVRRIIRRDESPKSQFFWDDNSTNGKTVRQTCLKKYNISVDNLCTFLPQDRVGSFSGFDSKQLLIETEKALSSSQDLYHTHVELIKAQEALKGGNNKVETMQEKLLQMQAEQKRLEREKERMEQREIALEQAELLKKKIMWLKFDHARDDALEKKQASVELKEKVKAAGAELKPLLEQHAEAEEKLKETNTEYQAMDREISKYRQEMVRQTKKYENHDDQIEQAVADLEAMDSHRRLLEEKVQRHKEDVEKYKSALEEFPPMDTMQQEENEARQEHKSILQPYDAAKRELRQLNDQARDVEEQRKHVQTKWAKMQDEKTQRRNRIFREQPNLKKIHEWILENRQVFRKEVVGPIACEITPKSRNAAAYIEQHLPNAVLKSFVVQDKDDYDLLYRKIRQEMKIPINIVVVEHVKQPRPRMYSDAKMKVLKEEHGIVGYMDESFTAPNVVLEALKAHGVERVLMGTDQTQQSLDNRNLLDFLSQPENGGSLQSCAIYSSAQEKSFKYTSNISKYSGKPSVRVDDVRPARWLAPGVSDDAKARVQSELQELDRQVEEFGPARNEAEKQLSEFQDKAQRAKARVKKSQEDIANLKRMINKLEGAKRKWKESQDALGRDDDEEKQQKIANIKNRIRASLSALEAQAQNYKKMMETTVRCSGMRLNREILKAEEERLR
jgi:chromosome segregation ATPase